MKFTKTLSVDLPVLAAKPMDPAVALLEQPTSQGAFSKAPLKFLITSIIATKTARRFAIAVTCKYLD